MKFQESYLDKVVSLLKCQLLEGAVSDKDQRGVTGDGGPAEDDGEPYEIEEGELPNSHGEHSYRCSCIVVFSLLWKCFWSISLSRMFSISCLRWRAC